MTSILSKTPTATLMEVKTKKNTTLQFYHVSFILKGVPGISVTGM